MIQDPKDWRTESSAYITKDRWFTLRQDRVRLPNGSVIDPYSVVESPDWVTVVATTTTDELVLIRQYRHAIGRVGLELPGGFVDDEDPISGGQRELIEETGFGGGTWRTLESVAPNPAVFNNWNYWVLAEGVERVADPSFDEGEDLVLDLRPIPSCMDLITSGEIFHALHVGALLRYLIDTR